jgi:voltage-gated potassium channel
LLDRPKSGTDSIAGVVIVILIGIALLLALVVFIILFIVSKSVYLSLYGTASVVIDATGVDFTTSLSHILNVNSANYYILGGVLVLGGILRLIVIGLVIGVFMEFLTGIKIKERLGLLSMRGLSNHVIICGYSELGSKIAEQLEQKKVKFVLVDNDITKYDMLRERGYRVVRGDFTKDETLKAALINSARCIVFASDEDFTNLIGIVTAKNLNKDLTVVARARDDNALNKMHRAGATLCVIPEVLAGLDIGNTIVQNVG